MKPYMGFPPQLFFPLYAFDAVRKMYNDNDGELKMKTYALSDCDPHSSSSTSTHRAYSVFCCCRKWISHRNFKAEHFPFYFHCFMPAIHAGSSNQQTAHFLSAFPWLHRLHYVCVCECRGTFSGVFVPNHVYSCIQNRNRFGWKGKYIQLKCRFVMIVNGWALCNSHSRRIEWLIFAEYFPHDVRGINGCGRLVDWA